MSKTEGPVFLIPLEDAKTPPVPRDEVARRYLGRLIALFHREKSEPFIADDKLHRATLKRLDEVVAPPACGPVLAEIGATVGRWLDRQPGGSHILTVVLPPCDENAVIETWASEAGHQVLAPPSRQSLVATEEPILPDMAGSGILVVPRLEDWFLRHRDGLRAVRALLAAIDGLDRPVVVGCNAWAWAYLAKATGADALLPDAVTIKPFDAVRLHGWFVQLSTSEATGAMRFRLPADGEDVLAVDEAGTPRNDYLRKLAGRSLGIPWVAWHLWRRSLRTGDDAGIAEDAKAAISDGEASEQTLWVAALDEYLLPGSDDGAALHALHALLIHGPLTREELLLVLPGVGEPNVLPVLLRAGFLERKGDRFGCRAAAYPAIRDGLEAAGFPAGRV
ncbi:hypothetical protein AFCDBAGC_4547 [Methylobacterium cerastii]|uniref:Uncharacterized protein n=1 Tax=Methylobacterium cerastii TaxID=932741 RepID=A0ABQ4QN80_9HYPH|nr:hypothetical protein AFCDBAGC_4547 [Methylobacterium cerastii]